MHTTNTRRVPFIVGRLTGIIAQPCRTFASLVDAGRHGAWLVAVLAIVAIGLHAYTYTWGFCQHTYRDELAWCEDHPGPGCPPRKPTPLLGTAALRTVRPILRTMLNWLVWTVSIYLVGVITGSSQMGVGAALRLALWSWTPHVIRSLAQTAYMFIARTAVFNQGLAGIAVDNTPTAMGVFTYVMPTRSQYLVAAVLSRIDVYTFWHLVLTGIGLVVWAGFPRRRAVFVTAATWITLGLIDLIPVLFPMTFNRLPF